MGISEHSETRRVGPHQQGAERSLIVVVIPGRIYTPVKSLGVFQGCRKPSVRSAVKTLMPLNADALWPISISGVVTSNRSLLFGLWTASRASSGGRGEETTVQISVFRGVPSEMNWRQSGAAVHLQNASLLFLSLHNSFC